MKESVYLDLKARAEKLIGQETFFDVSVGQKAESVNCKFIALSRVFSTSENDGPRIYGNVMGVLQMPDGTTFERPLQQIVAWLENKNTK